MDCSLPSSSVCGVFPGKNTGVGCHFLLRGSSLPRDLTQVSCIAGRVLKNSATREAHVCGGTDINEHFAQTVKNLPGVQETWVHPLGWEDPLEKEMVTHSSILA